MSPQKANATTKRFIAVEHGGRQVAIRRSANYDVSLLDFHVRVDQMMYHPSATSQITLTLVKEAFKSLGSVDAERILISAFVEELGDSLEISKDIWSDLLPELKRITITFDSSPPKSEGSDANGSDVEEESLEVDHPDGDTSETGDSDDDRLSEDMSAEDQTPEPTLMTHRRLAKPRPSGYSTLTLPRSLPRQTDSAIEQQYRVKIFYFHKNRPNWTSAEVLTGPTTTIVDLQE
ncbi:hypothetical protein FRC07_003113 [Ceratobasidium sp. 392]|nr:hypothetical protein FRC07_003113 [Ceratobasidium sp. 392]